MKIIIIFLVFLSVSCTEKKENLTPHFLGQYKNHSGPALFVSKARSGLDNIISLGKDNKSPLVRELVSSFMSKPEFKNIERLI